MEIGYGAVGGGEKCLRAEMKAKENRGICCFCLFAFDGFCFELRLGWWCRGRSSYIGKL